MCIYYLVSLECRLYFICMFYSRILIFWNCLQIGTGAIYLKLDVELLLPFLICRASRCNLNYNIDGNSGYWTVSIQFIYKSKHI